MGDAGTQDVRTQDVRTQDVRTQDVRTQDAGTQEPQDVDVSVILCVRDGADRMAGQIEAVLAQDWARPWELLIVDNGSTDDTASVAHGAAARSDRVRVIDASERRGLSYARNVGVAHARGRSVVFCDDDDRVGVGWLAAMGEALDRHEVVAPRLEYELLAEPGANTGRAAFQSGGLETVFGVPIVNGVGGWRRSLWLALGGNDEHLDFSGEDHDLALRAHLDAKVTPVFCPDAVYHCRRRSGGGAAFRQARRYGQAHVFLYRRHGRELGARPERVGKVLREWAWLARHAADRSDPESATTWAYRVGIRAGRLEGMVRFRTWYP